MGRLLSFLKLSSSRAIALVSFQMAIENIRRARECVSRASTLNNFLLFITAELNLNQTPYYDYSLSPKQKWVAFPQSRTRERTDWCDIITIYVGMRLFSAFGNNNKSFGVLRIRNAVSAVPSSLSFSSGYRLHHGRGERRRRHGYQTDSTPMLLLRMLLWWCLSLLCSGECHLERFLCRVSRVYRRSYRSERRIITTHRRCARALIRSGSLPLLLLLFAMLNFNCSINISFQFLDCQKI